MADNSPEDLGYTSPAQDEMFSEIAGDVPDRFSYPVKLAELERELGHRRRLYPRWVADGKMKQETADRQIAVLEAIIADYQIRPWPQTKKFVAEWHPHAERIKFMGVRLTAMHREELLAVVAFAKSALETLAEKLKE